MSLLLNAAVGGVAILAAYLVLGNLWHRLLSPLPAPDPSTFPRSGDRFGSVAEGVVQEVTQVSDGRIAARTFIAPGAAGPPMHVHERFSETFAPRGGTLRMHLPDGTVDLAPGDSLVVPPGIAHRFSNPTPNEVVLESDTAGLPVAFAAMLVQLYRIMDARGTHPVTMLLQMSVIDPAFDIRLARVPRPVASALRVVLGPAARLLGFRNYYPEYALHSGTAPVGARSERCTTS